MIGFLYRSGGSEYEPGHAHISRLEWLRLATCHHKRGSVEGYAEVQGDHGRLHRWHRPDACMACLAPATWGIADDASSGCRGAGAWLGLAVDCGSGLPVDGENIDARRQDMSDELYEYKVTVAVPSSVNRVSGHTVFVMAYCRDTAEGEALAKFDNMPMAFTKGCEFTGRRMVDGVVR